MFGPVVIFPILLGLAIFCFIGVGGEFLGDYERRKWKETLKELHDEIELENGSVPQHFYERVTTAYREVKKKAACEEEFSDDCDD